jgi:hypothetical protein
MASLGLSDFVSDDAADGGAADGSDSAAARQDGASDSTDTGTDGGALVLIRHPGASAQAKQQGRGQRAERESLGRLHDEYLVR